MVQARVLKFIFVNKDKNFSTISPMLRQIGHKSTGTLGMKTTIIYTSNMHKPNQICLTE